MLSPLLCLLLMKSLLCMLKGHQTPPPSLFSPFFSKQGPSKRYGRKIVKTTEVQTTR